MFKVIFLVNRQNETYQSDLESQVSLSRAAITLVCNLSHFQSKQFGVDQEITRRSFELLKALSTPNSLQYRMFPGGEMKLRRVHVVLSMLYFALAHISVARAQSAPTTETVEVDTNGPSRPFPHFWEQMFGSGRAALSLRESYRNDLREVKSITDFKYIRFHAILNDEVGMYDEDASGNPIYNFSYVDQIYDGLLQNHVRPFVELSFMPGKLASADIRQAFWYKPIVAPPKDYDRWGTMISAFAKHLIDRYGIDEVSQWYFEVWNEPNLDFWAGDPKEATYYRLYDVTAVALKAVNSRLRIGGPATAQAAWADRFIRHAAENNIPIDFVSTHVYGNDTAHDVFGTQEPVPMDQMVCRAVDKVHRQIKSSAKPNLPLIWSEFNAVYDNQTKVTDSAFMGPWLGDTIRRCDGLVDMMSYWSFSDVFEEQGVIKKPFYGGFGILAEGGVPKPAFNAFKLLHQLGDQRIDVQSDSMLVTKRANGSLAIALWNFSLPDDPGKVRNITIHLQNLTGARGAQIREVDPDRGSPLPSYHAMGDPVSPTLAQYTQLKKAAQLPAARAEKIKDGKIALTLPPKSLFLIEIQ
jgi:xylan 1,4-beta-xylosidase